MNSNKLFESKVFTSGLTEKFCLLCGYGIEHKEADHTSLLMVMPDPEFLDGLKAGDLVPTAYGYAPFVGWHYRTPMENLPYGFSVLPRTDVAIVEYSANWVRQQELVLLSDYWRVEIDKTLLRKFTMFEQEHIRMNTSYCSASQILDIYRKPDDTNYLEIMEKEIEAEIELDQHRSNLLDWVGSTRS